MNHSKHSRSILALVLSVTAVAAAAARPSESGEPITSTGFQGEPPGGRHTHLRRELPAVDVSTWHVDFGCPSILVDLSTGLEPTAGTLIQHGEYDLKWSIVHDETAWTVEPRPAKVVPKYYMWTQPHGGTRWISALDAMHGELANTVVFETEFCIRSNDSQDVWFEIGAKAPGQVEAYLNQPLADVIAGTASSMLVGQHATQQLLVNMFSPFGLLPGKNIVHFRVRKDCTCQQSLDLDAVFRVHSASANLEHPKCCSPKNAISGRVFCDFNQDGVEHKNEPSLGGWTVRLSNGQIVTADSRGRYLFYPLANGTYRVSHVPPAAWTETLPGGAYVVSLSSFQHADDRDFGSFFSCGHATVDSMVKQGTTTTFDVTVCNESCMEICEIRLVPTSGAPVAPLIITTSALLQGDCEQIQVALQTGVQYSIELRPCEVAFLIGPCVLDTTLLSSCEWDLNGDGKVDGLDLALLLNGTFPSVSGEHLSALVAAWGPC